ncbi:MAG: SPOR domain-containing protein [Pseudomonadota bacterium]|nr:MAG: SPOR domain-containing protein [Pseudomonadota bacterium]
MRDQLRKKGYRAFVEAVTTADGKFFRVRVGPEVRREAAEALKKDIGKKMKMETMVVRHP